MVFDRFFGSGEEPSSSDSEHEPVDDAAGEEIPSTSSDDQTETKNTGAESSSDQQPNSDREQYQIVDQNTTRVGGKPILTDTANEGTVAGPYVREMFEAGMYNAPAPLWVGYTEDPQTGFREAPLRFDSLFRHNWIAGTTGYGKTTQLLNMMVQWAYSGYGFTYFDPKGQDSRELLRMLPKHRLEDVVWIEPGSTTHENTVGMNFLEVPECETAEELENEIENRVENLKAVFDTSDYWGINMEAITESMARAMMKSEKPFSIIDMYFILLNADRREDFALDVEDPYIREFCLEIAEMEEETVRPLLKRIKSWVENSVIRRIKCEQIVHLYEENADRLESIAESVKSGTIENSDLTAGQVLFIASLRDLQEESGINPNINHVKFRQLLRGVHKGQDGDELAALDKKPRETETIERQLQNTGQLVFYGPPGTGKTYTAQRFARWWLNQQPGR
ncbi:hypothetical protein EL22_28540 [Halostagnicola sp. A56]|nr:hypothetical protein EL22_28540 [Halostagnicola sp. A56]